MPKTERGNAPVAQPVPWNTPVEPDFAAPPSPPEPPPPSPPTHVASNEPPQPSVFNPEPPRKSPFAPPAKKVEAKKEDVYPLGENDPSWIDLVRFVQKHGDRIIQARYPHPRGVCIDTIHRGVTVFAHPTTQVRHAAHGWIDWQDAIY